MSLIENKNDLITPSLIPIEISLVCRNCHIPVTLTVEAVDKKDAISEAKWILNHNSKCCSSPSYFVYNNLWIE